MLVLLLTVAPSCVPLANIFKFVPLLVIAICVHALIYEVSVLLVIGVQPPPAQKYNVLDDSIETPKSIVGYSSTVKTLIN